MDSSEKTNAQRAVPKVRPIKPDVPDAPMAQPRYETLPRIPTRALLIGPSGSAKTTTLIWWLMEGAKGLFDRIYIFCKNQRKRDFCVSLLFRVSKIYNEVPCIQHRALSHLL